MFCVVVGCPLIQGNEEVLNVFVEHWFKAHEADIDKKAIYRAEVPRSNPVEYEDAVDMKYLERLMKRCV